MNILSYRGSHAPGGVSSALSHIFNNYAHSAKWWHIKDQQLVLEAKLHRRSSSSKELPIDRGLLDNHYKYCNETIWPSMHDLPQYCDVSAMAHGSYKRFNRIIAKRLLQEKNSDAFFINDYQFALMPKMLDRANCLVFWHIPWPKHVEPEYASALVEVTDALLSSNVVAFHTQEYVDNYLNLVSEFLPDCRISGNSVIRKSGSETLVVSAPLGLDTSHWSHHAYNRPPEFLSQFDGEKIFLSVDRGDYTKGILDRLEAIDIFLMSNPQYYKQVRFVQILTHSRSGLKSFDNYAESASSMAKEINARYRTDDWEPIAWIEDSMPMEQLAAVYRRADVMMVTPVRDGLNLTAKEYVACQQSQPGALILSEGAGVWHELGRYAISTKPGDSEHMSDMILRSLQMTDSEKFARMRLMQRVIRSNTLSDWWSNLIDQWKAVTPVAIPTRVSS